MKFRLFALILILQGFSAFTQPVNEQLAIQYYNNGEFDKALDLFEQLYFSNSSSQFYYDYYLNCLLNLKDYKQAEAVAKKQIKKFPENPSYQVDLGYIYGLAGDSKKKIKIYTDLISSLKPDNQKIALLANALILRKEYAYAIEVYQKARKIFNNNAIFSYPLADLYQKTGQLTPMFQEYINLLKVNPEESEIIENKLQDVVAGDSAYHLLSELLITEIQSSAFNPDLIDLLVWLFVQRKDFKNAFIQVKALDKRLKDNNTRLVQLAELCMSNQDYEVADEIYNYILSKGEATPYYYHAKFGLIEVRYLKITSNQKPSVADLTEVESLYTDFLNREFYRFPDISEKVILRLAEIKAVYLGKTKEAIDLLEKYLKVPQITKTTQAYMKMALADYQVLNGNVYDAILLYLQVYNMYRDHPIGHEAKFRNARLSFFMGDFEWATDQLEVLKASTSELISNDALRLSLLIQDVLGIDSNEVPLKMYARGDFFMFKNQLDSASAVFDSIISGFQGHELIDDAWFAKAQIEAKKSDYQKAIEFYQKIFTDYRYGILADVSLFEAARIYEEKLKSPEKAKELYEKLITEYPDSVYIVEARKRFRILRGEKNI